MFVWWLGYDSSLVCLLPSFSLMPLLAYIYSADRGSLRTLSYPSLRCRFTVFPLSSLMPTPAVIAGLVVGAVLGSGLLCLGAYFVHQYMNLQSRKINGWFHRNALVVRRDTDVEKGIAIAKLRGGRVNADTQRDQTKIRPATRKTRRKLGYGFGRKERNTALRGGGDEWEDDAGWADERQLQGYTPNTMPANARPTAYPRVLGWGQQQSSYDQMWCSPAWYHEVPPQGALYIPPYTELRIAYPQAAFVQPSWANRRYVLNPGGLSFSELSLSLHCSYGLSEG